MVLIGLIIVAVVLVALRVPGIQWGCRRQCQPQARTGQRPDTQA
jgi:hypothetical protein